MSKLKVILCILLVFLLSSCGVSLHTSKNSLKSTTKSTVNVDTNSANMPSVDIENVKKQLATLEKALTDDNKKEVILKHLNDFKENCGLKTSSIYFGDETGNLYMTPIVELPSDYDPRIRPWYKAAKEDVEYASDIYIDPITNDKLLSVSRAIYKNKSLIGVVGIDLVVEDNEKNK